MQDDKQDNLQDALVDLQTQIAFQEETLSQLNEVVTRQQGQIDRLLEEVKFLGEKYRDVQEALDDRPGNEKPPHY